MCQNKWRHFSLIYFIFNSLHNSIWILSKSFLSHNLFKMSNHSPKTLNIFGFLRFSEHFLHYLPLPFTQIFLFSQCHVVPHLLENILLTLQTQRCNSKITFMKCWKITFHTLILSTENHSIHILEYIFNIKNYIFIWSKYFYISKLI